MRFARPSDAVATAVVLIAVAGLSLSPDCRAQVLYTGVNLSGAEFGASNLPGTFGTDYTYPTNAEVDYYVGKGMNTFRLPFRWERLQPTANSAFNAAELGRLNLEPRAVGHRSIS